jgi:hypothetical protein
MSLIVGIVVIAVIIAILIALFAIPVPHAFSRTFSGSLLSPGSASIDPPKGSQVSGSYTVTGFEGGIPITIFDALQDDVFTGLGNAGSFSFTAAFPPYTFTGSGGSVSVSGTISYPVI